MNKPTKGTPGSEEKILALCYRYEHGLPLWHSDDKRGYGPTEAELQGRFAVERSGDGDGE